MNRAVELRKLLTGMQSDLNIKKDRLERATKRKEDIENKIASVDLESSEQAFKVLQKLSERQRNAAKERLEELGTQALQYSMGPNYRMVIEIPDSSRRPQAYLYIIDDETGVKTDPLDDNGGGIVDIISIALRLVVLQSYETEHGVPEIDGPILLDEPFKMVSKEYIPMLSDFLKKISKDFDRQIIMVTHNEFLAESCESEIKIN